MSDPEEQRFTSYQEVKVQEKMQCLDMGSTPSTLSVLLLHELADSIKPGGEQLESDCFLVPHNDQGRVLKSTNCNQMLCQASHNVYHPLLMGPALVPLALRR